jgi:protein subunit release factor A
VRDLHLTRKDFSIDWFSGTGGGGQHRNKHQNCCRIVHLETGIMATGQTERDRPSNQAKAFKELAKRLVAYYTALDEMPRDINTTVIRNYHAERNEVLDKASGLRRPYRDVVIGGNLAEMIEARLSVMACFASDTNG